MSVIMVALHVAGYLGLNFVLNYGNKLLMEQFHFPIFVILVGTLVYLPLAAALIQFGRVSTFPTMAMARGASRELITIGIIHAIGTAAQNWSLSGVMSVGLNQVIKASTPAVTLVATYLLQHVRYHWSLIVSTIVVVAGSGLTVYTSSDATTSGVLLCLTSSVFGGLEGVLTGMLMRRHDMHPVQTSFLIGPIAALTLLAPFFWLEFSMDFLRICEARGAQLAGSVLALSLCAAGYSYLHYWLIAALGAHYCNLIGSFKLALIVGVSFFAIESAGKGLSLLNLAGILMTLVGFAAYSILRAQFPDNDRNASNDLPTKETDALE
jgi:drug/metabolite transporter (DMT)-like permease